MANSTTPRRARTTAAVCVLAAALGTPTAAAEEVARRASPATGVSSVVVLGEGPGTGPLSAAVTSVGGRVEARFASLGGVSADVPEHALDELQQAPGVRSVTVDGTVRSLGEAWNAEPVVQDGEWLPEKDLGSLYNTARHAGAHQIWTQSDANGNKITGRGVGVALLDSGVVPVDGLRLPGKIVNGPDLSFESQADNLRHLDTYGHGTHLAGIVAGRDDAVRDGNEHDSRNLVGIAPDAHVVNLKVADAGGATDVSQVLAAIDWIVQHRDDEGVDVRVLNLSYGTDSTQSSVLDPLSYAAEVAWRHGIVVVVAAGNDGLEQPRLTMPAQNPYVLSVGALDMRGNTDPADDQVAGFSNGGDSTRRADLVAPGRSIVSLRSPGSYIDAHYPRGLVDGDASQRFFRGSGTSQAAAVVSGAVALLLQQRPELTPDQVKALLTSTARPLLAGDVAAGGAGALDLKKAYETATPVALQEHETATGTGSLELSRGTSHVADPEDGVELVGELDVFGQAWDGTSWAADSLAGRAWHGGTWRGQSWSGEDWGATSFAGRAWHAGEWLGTNWTGRAWHGRAWHDANWNGETWSGRAWHGGAWQGRAWHGVYASSLWG
jgi:serine protease AprX